MEASSLPHTNNPTPHQTARAPGPLAAAFLPRLVAAPCQSSTKRHQPHGAGGEKNAGGMKEPRGRKQSFPLEEEETSFSHTPVAQTAPPGQLSVVLTGWAKAGITLGADWVHRGHHLLGEGSLLPHQILKHSTCRPLQHLHKPHSPRLCPST